MHVSQEVPLASALKGSAAKVLLHLLLNPDDTKTNAAIMRGSGVHDRRTYFQAKAQLRGLGLWENPSAIFLPGSVITQPGRGITLPGSVITPPPSRETQPPIKAQLHADVSRSFFDVLLDADNLDDTGEWNSSASPVRLRREAQITALQEAYRVLFEGKELTKTSATELIRLADDRAAPVYGALEKAKERGAEFPVGYAKKVLQGDQSKQASTNPVQVGKPGEEDFYMEPSPEYLAKVERFRRLGLLNHEEDD